jgi:hypothetical protein
MKSPSSAGRLQCDETAIRIGLEAAKKPLVKDYGMQPAKPTLKTAKPPKDEKRMMPENDKPQKAKKFIPKRKK